MAFVFLADSNPVAGTADTTPADVTDVTPIEGDHAFITVSWKRAGATLATPTDWDLIASATVGTGTPGAADGPIEIRVYYRQVPSGGLSMPTLTMGGDSTGRVVQAGCVVYRGDLGAGGVLDYEVTSGSDTSSDTSWSITGAADIDIQTDDAVLVYGSCTVATSTTFTSPTIATTGVTYGSTGNPFSSSTTSGDDLRSWSSRAIATAGPSSAAPTFSATVGANTTGGAVFLRLREAAPAVTGTAAADFGFTAAATGRPYPVLVQTSGTTFSGTNALTLSATLPGAATAGNMLWFLVAGDKNLDPFTPPSGFTQAFFLRTGNVSLYAGWKVAAGGETTVSATVTTGDNQGGSDVWVGEYSQAGTEDWQIKASGSSSDDGSTVLTKSSGTTGTVGGPGRALAAWAVDSINTEGTASYTNDYAERANPSAGAGTCAGLWIAERDISTAGGTTESTITRSGGGLTADQMCGGIVVFGRGDGQVEGTASAQLGFVSTADGVRVAPGSAAADFGFTAAASGSTPAVEGSAAADFGFIAAAFGSTGPTPGSAFDLADWKLTLPTDGGDGDTSADEITQPELDTYDDANFALAGSDLVMTAPVVGATTSGSSATRCELREMEDGTEAAWDMATTGLRQLTVTGIFDPTGITGGTTPRKEMIVGQIHGTGGTPPLYLAVEHHVASPRLRVFKDGPGVSNPLTGLTSATEITYRIRIDAGRVQVWAAIGQVGDLPTTPQFDWAASDFTQDTSACYLKAGAYNKTTVASGSTGSAIATISHLELIQPETGVSGTATAGFGFTAEAFGTSPVRLPAHPGEALWIGTAAGKNHFNIGIGGPLGGADHTDYDQEDIQAGAEPPVQPLKFLLTDDRSAVQFGINVDDGRTSVNTTYPRSELRELDEEGDLAAWDGSTGVHYMRGRSRVTGVAELKPWVVIFQIHGPDDDLVRVQTESGGTGSTGLRLRARRVPAAGGAEASTTLLAAYELGDWLDWEIRVGGGAEGDSGDNDGRLRIWINGVVVMDVAGGGDLAGCYFKAGCYAQSNTGTEDGDDTQFFTTEIAEGTFQAWHTGYATPTTPVYTGDTVAVTIEGAASSVFGFTAEAAGVATTTEKTGTAAAALGFTATASGTPTTFGTATAVLGFTAHMKGPGIEVGTATAVLGFTATAAGARRIPGAAAVALGFTAAAAGTVTDALGVPFLMDELGFGASLAVEIAWGANLNSDSSTWVWTDITNHVRADPGISTKLGRADEASVSQPASCTMVLDNSGRHYSAGGRSPNWPNVRRGTPVRVRIDPADGGGFRSVLFGRADGFTPGWDVMNGSLPVVTLSVSGTLRRLAQGDSPVISAYRRAMTATQSVVAYWPFEEGRLAGVAPAVRGGSDMTSASIDHEFDTADNFDCSAPLLTLHKGDGLEEAFAATVDPYPVTGQTQIRWLMTIPDGGLPHGAFLLDARTTGTAARWIITFSTETSTAGALNITVLDSSGGVILERLNIRFLTNGKNWRYSLEMTQSGSNINYRLATVAPSDTSEAFNVTGTITGRTVGRVTSVAVGGNDVDNTAVGHVTVQNETTSLFEATGPMRAHRGEFPSSGNPAISRMDRLCSENGVKLTRYTTTIASDSLFNYEQMGPQLVAPLLTLLRECETTDQGQLWDGLDDGLSYTTRRRRELGSVDGAVKLTIDAAAGELAPPFDPVDDDQRIVNKAEGKLLRRTSATYEDVDGPLGTDKIGIYDSSLEANSDYDLMAVHYAAWQVHLGTTPGYRYPSVTVNLRAAPQLAVDVLTIVPGERIRVVNLDDTLDGFEDGTVSLIVEGISHEITPTSWTVTFSCSPFSPWSVARAAAETGDTSELVFRADTDASYLASSASAGATSISVATGPLTLATDAFARTSTNSWGSADLGGAWSLAGTSGTTIGDFDVAGGVGTVSVGAADRVQSTYLAGLNVQDVDIVATVTLPFSNVTGGHVEPGCVLVRGTSLNDFYFAAVQITTAEAVAIGIAQVAAAVTTELATPQIVSGLTFSGQALRVRLQAKGRTLRARVWAASGSEPSVWHTEVVTSTPAVSGWVGIRNAVAAGNTNTKPIVFSHDNLTVTTADTIGPVWTTVADDYPLNLDVGGVKVTATACSGATSPQTFTVAALPVARAAGLPVKLHDPRPLGL